jgi:putative transposase
MDISGNRIMVREGSKTPAWGYDRIQGAVANIRHQVSPTTVHNILKIHGIDPAPHRKNQTTWKTFLTMH